MTDMNETSPRLLMPEHDSQPKELQKKRPSRLEKQIEALRKGGTSSEHEEEDVGEKANTSGGTTITSGDDETDITSGILKTETPSPSAGDEAEELLTDGEKVEKSEDNSPDTNKEQENK
jgi:hypothetical protein